MTTHLLIPSAVVCVPESQRADYEKRLAADMPKIAPHTSMRGWIVTHPDSVKGLTAKLNWIFDWFDRQPGISDTLVFIDDDITAVQRCFTDRGEESTIRDPRLIETIITNTARLARDLGAFYFGWEASNGALRYYTGLKPFALTGYINGCAMGFRRGHGLRFDERIVAKNDFDIAAANARQHRLCLKVKRVDELDKAGSAGVAELLTLLDYLPKGYAIIATTNDFAALRASWKGRLETRFVRLRVEAPSIMEVVPWLVRTFRVTKTQAQAIARGAVPDGQLDGVNVRAALLDADALVAVQSVSGHNNGKRKALL